MALDYKGSLNRYRKYLQIAQSQPLVQASLWLILSLLLMIGIVVWALRPTLVTVAGLLGQIKQQETVAEQLDQKIVNVQAAGEELQKVSSKMDIINEALPEEPNWEKLATSIEKMATDSGVTLTAITFGNAPIKGKIATVPTDPVRDPNEIKPTLPVGVAGISFIITGQGEYEELRELINKIEATRRMLILTSVQMARQENGQLLLSIKGVATYLIPTNLP